MSQKLVLKNINKHFGSLVAVNNVNLEIEPGEFLCFLGPSGCGKTTLLRIITGFEQPSSGTIEYNGQIINDIIPQKRDFGIVFQSYALFPNMTVEQNVAFGLKMRKMPKPQINERVSEILKLVGLTEWKTHYPAQLSGGQQQRVALGRAIAIKPKVLLLDEPLSALDAKIRVKLRSVIKRLQQDLGITMIYVTHDQEEALSMADRVAIMKDGDIQQIGSPWEIYKSPTSSFVAGFVGTSNFMTGKKEGEKISVGGYSLSVNGSEKIKQDTVYLAIRPEKILMIMDGTNTQSYLKNNIVDVKAEVITFLGSVVQITFTIDDKEMNVDITESDFERVGIRRGDNIKLYFPPEAFHSYAERPGSAV